MTSYKRFQHQKSLDARRGAKRRENKTGGDQPPNGRQKDGTVKPRKSVTKNADTKSDVPGLGKAAFAWGMKPDAKKGLSKRKKLGRKEQGRQKMKQGGGEFFSLQPPRARIYEKSQ